MAAKYQFLNIQIYPLEKSSQNDKGTVFDNEEEEMRRTWAAKHVAHPMRPTVFGDPKATLRELAKGAKEQHDSMGRRQKRDTPVDISVVVSYPTPMDEMTSGEFRRYKRWARASFNWLMRKFHALGAKFGYGVEHLDEAFGHLHLHFQRRDRPGASVKPCHPGHSAGKQYKKAMSEFQDEYHRDVCSHFGMARKSARPRKRIHRRHHLDGIIIYKDQLPPPGWKARKATEKLDRLAKRASRRTLRDPVRRPDPESPAPTPQQSTTLSEPTAAAPNRAKPPQPHAGIDTSPGNQLPGASSLLPARDAPGSAINVDQEQPSGAGRRPRLR